MSLHYEKVEAKVGFGTEKEVKYIGRRRLQDPFTLERLSKEVAHITGLPQATAEIVFRYMVQAVEDAIQDGRSVDLGIGTLSPAISSKAAEDEEGVKITRKRILFRASKRLRTIVQNMSVRLIGDEDNEVEDDLTPDDNDGTGNNESASQTPSPSEDDNNGGNNTGGGGQN